MEARAHHAGLLTEGGQRRHRLQLDLRHVDDARQPEGRRLQVESRRLGVGAETPELVYRKASRALTCFTLS